MRTLLQPMAPLLQSTPTTTQPSTDKPHQRRSQYPEEVHLTIGIISSWRAFAGREVLSRASGCSRRLREASAPEYNHFFENRGFLACAVLLDELILEFPRHPSAS